MSAFLRSIVAVLAGYVVFAVSAFAVFRLSGQAPHAVASGPVVLLTIAAGIVFAIAGGYMAAWIAGRRPLAHGIAVALVLALGAGASLVATVGHGAIWSQIAALLCMAPAAATGGWLRAGAPVARP